MIRAWFLRWCHCLWKTLTVLKESHCGVDITIAAGGRVVGCTCGRVFYNDRVTEGDASKLCKSLATKGGK